MNGVGGGPQITPQIEQQIAKEAKGKNAGETARIGQDSNELRFGKAKGKVFNRNVQALEAKTLKTMMKFNEAILNTVKDTSLSDRTIKALDTLLPNFVHRDGNQIMDFRVQNMTIREAHTLLEVTKEDRQAAAGRTPASTAPGEGSENGSDVSSSAGSVSSMSDFDDGQIESYAESRSEIQSDDDSGYATVRGGTPEERVANLRQNLVDQERKHQGLNYADLQHSPTGSEVRQSGVGTGYATVQPPQTSQPEAIPVDEGIEADQSSEVVYASMSEVRAGKFRGYTDLVQSGNYVGLVNKLKTVQDTSFLENLKGKIAEVGGEHMNNATRVVDKRIEHLKARQL